LEIESGDSEGEQVESVEPWALPDLSQVKGLAETREGLGSGNPLRTSS